MRDRELEAAMYTKVAVARQYFEQVIAEFHTSHPQLQQLKLAA